MTDPSKPHPFYTLPQVIIRAVMCQHWMIEHWKIPLEQLVLSFVGHQNERLAMCVVPKARTDIVNNFMQILGDRGDILPMAVAKLFQDGWEAWTQTPAAMRKAMVENNTPFFREIDQTCQKYMTEPS